MPTPASPTASLKVWPAPTFSLLVTLLAFGLRPTVSRGM